MKVTVGADPELFVFDSQGNPVSAHGMIPGTKEKPHPVPNGAVQVDGMALEFNIDPAETEDEFVNNIQSVLKSLDMMVDGDLNISPTVEFEQEVMDSAPENAKILGCDPDYNAYTGEANPEPKPPEGKNIRTAAGHIHIGWTEGVDPHDPEHFEACQMLAKQLDYYLGIYSMSWDQDDLRRQVYGKAGAFRPKSYGMEYRVLSNQWIKDEKLIRWVYQATMLAFDRLVEGDSAENRLGKFARGLVDYGKYGPNTEACLKHLVKAMGMEYPVVSYPDAI